MRDLLIVGGGPAGCATALAASAAGLDVTLVEAARPPVRKVCGEFLSEHGFDSWVGLTGASAQLHPRITRVVFRHDPTGRTTRPIALDPVAYGVSRSTLDEALLRAALRAGVRVIRGVRAGRPVRDGADAWRVDIRGDGAGPGSFEVLTARRVVRATGRPADPGGEWFGVRGSTDSVSDPDRLDMTLLADGSYYGRSAVEGGAACLCGLSRTARAPWGHGTAAGATSSTVVRGTPRFHPGFQASVPGDDLVVGDALAAWPPLVGDGMTVALLSGTLLGLRLGRDPGLTGGAWVRLWREQYAVRLRDTLRLHAVLTSPRWGAVAFQLLAGHPAMAQRVARSVRRHPRGGSDLVRPEHAA